MKSTYFRFGSPLRRPAPILLDLVADHILAKYWSEYTALDLHEFTQRCYDSIGQFEIPLSAQSIYQHMCRTDLFANYADLKVIHGIAHRILKRLGYTQHSNKLASILVSEHNKFKQDFEAYYPLLEQKVVQWKHNRRD